MNKAIQTSIKYRPNTIKDVVFATDEVKETAMMYAEGLLKTPLILYGPHGTGKSLLAQLIPESIDGPNVAVDQLTNDDMKSRATVGKSLVRSMVFDNLCELEGQKNYYKIFNDLVWSGHIVKDAVRVAMDSMEGRQILIITTNEFDKIDSGVRSRCECVEVPGVAPVDFLEKAMYILTNEGLQIPESKVLAILEKCQIGTLDNRKYYQVLDRVIARYHSKQA